MAQKEFRETVAEHWDEIVEAGSSPPPPLPNETWITRLELARRWQVAPATLDQWASQGRGPKYAKFGRHARYPLSGVIQWENEQLGGGDMASEAPAG